MDELKMIIANNIAELRKRNNLTQAELAEKLNYSDKAISKWERGESIPDVAVLKSVADLFGVKVDYLLNAEHTDENDLVKKISRRKVRNRIMITGISVLLVWLIATAFFSNASLILNNYDRIWLVFVYAVPVSMIVWLVFNAMWFNQKWNFLIVSLLMWSSLAALCLTLFFIGGVHPWLLFAIGAPGQLIIVFWSGIKIKRKNKNKNNNKRQ